MQRTPFTRKLTLAALAVGIFLAWLPAGGPGAAPAPPGGEILEDLRYRVDILILKDSLPARVTFQRLGPGRFRGEITGEARGLLGLISGRWRGSYSTEMVLANGKLLPVVYREESRHGDKRQLNEYRFDYDKNRVELYKLDQKKGLVKKWETALTQPMYDGISFYYNQRLGLMGLGKEEEVRKFPGIPYPKREEITLRLGPVTPKGRKVMVFLANPVFEKGGSEVYAFLDQDGVPTQAWTWVLKYGKISGTLLPGGKRLRSEEVLAGIASPSEGTRKGL